MSVLIVHDIITTPKQRLIGFGAALITVFVWSSYFLSLRIGALSPLTLVELTFFRYAVPGLLLLPVFLKSWKIYKTVSPLYLVGIIVGSGLPFFILSAHGMKLTQVAYGSTLIPGTVPLFVTLLAVLIYKQPLPNFRRLGLLGIIGGILAMVLHAGGNWDTNLLLGQGIFLICAFLWALFTLSIRQAALAPLQVAALAALPNGILIFLWMVLTSPMLGYHALPLLDVLAQLIVQGFFVGIVSGLCFSAAIVRLGAEKTSAIGAATPAVATLMATVMLGETMDSTLLIGMALVIGGVVLASGVVHGERVS